MEGTPCGHGLYPKPHLALVASHAETAAHPLVAIHTLLVVHTSPSDVDRTLLAVAVHRTLVAAHTLDVLHTLCADDASQVLEVEAEAVVGIPAANKAVAEQRVTPYPDQLGHGSIRAGQSGLLTQ